MFIRRRLPTALSALAILSACGGDTSPTEPTAYAPSLAIVSGDGVAAAVGSSVNVTVQVTGVTLPNQQIVNFVVTSGGGSVYAPTVQTARPTSGPGAGQSGIASNVWVYGTQSGPQTLEARLISPSTGAVILVGRLTGSATPGPAAQLAVTLGDNQTAVVGAAVAVRPAVTVSDQYGNGIVGVNVIFAVSQGSGTVIGAAQTTDASGLATVGSWTLGAVTGPNEITATTPSLTLSGSPARIVALARPAVASKLVTTLRVFSPRIGTVISPVARVTDVGGNGIANMAVTFTVRTGGGALDGVSVLTTLTDAAGNARVDWTVGPSILSNTLQATAQGLQGSPITFVAVPYECDCWSARAPLPTVRRDIGAGVINGLIHTAVGGLTDGTYYSTLEVYNPSTNQWTTKSPVSAPYAFPASGVINGLLHLASGFGPPGLLDRVQAYDPVLDQWTPKAPIPTRRIEAASAVMGGLLYVMGGDNSGNGTASSTVEAYDPIQDQWTTKAALPTARFLAQAGNVNGRIYIAGGKVGPQVLARLDVYDPAANSWTAASPMPTPRYGVTVAVANGLLYVIGGNNPGKLATVEVYDPATDVWVTRTAMPTARGTAVSAVVNGIIFVLSGRNHNGVEAFGTNEGYQP